MEVFWSLNSEKQCKTLFSFGNRDFLRKTQVWVEEQQVCLILKGLCLYKEGLYSEVFSSYYTIKLEAEQTYYYEIVKTKWKKRPV